MVNYHKIASAAPIWLNKGLMSTTLNTTLPPVVRGTTFEEQAAAFEADERVHFSKETGAWRYETEDGIEMEWDVSKSAWIPVVRSVLF